METICQYYTTFIKRLTHLCLLMSLWVQDPVSSRYRKKRVTSRMECTEHTVSRPIRLACARDRNQTSYAWSWDYLHLQSFERECSPWIVTLGLSWGHCFRRLWNAYGCWRKSITRLDRLASRANLGLPQTPPPRTGIISLFNTGCRDWTQILILCDNTYPLSYVLSPAT